MSAAAPPKLLTIDEYLRLPDDGRKTELVRGRVIEVPPPDPFHGFLCLNFGAIIREFVRANNLGRAIGNDSGVVTGRDPDSFRGADVCYYSYAQMPAGPFSRKLYPTAIPDLVVEVRSPSDRRSQVLAKVTEYLSAGVTAVCIVNPDAGTAIIYRDNQDPEPVAAAADLTFPDVLPGFRVPLRQFFE